MGSPHDFGEREIYDTPKDRFCTYFHGLNAVIKIPVYAISDIKGSLPLMAGSHYFNLVAKESAYWRIPIHPDDKIGFITPFGSFHCERLADGLVGALSTFKNIMDATLMGLKGINARLFG